MRKSRRHQRRELTGGQEMELLFGLPPSGESAFESVFRARAGWQQFRAEFMTDNNPGWRPGGFWRFESPERPRPGESDAACLRRLGQLSAEEEAQLAAGAQLRGVVEEVGAYGE